MKWLLLAVCTFTLLLGQHLVFGDGIFARETATFEICGLGSCSYRNEFLIDLDSKKAIWPMRYIALGLVVMLLWIVKSILKNEG
jgi:hypothetical protein